MKSQPTTTGASFGTTQTLLKVSSPLMKKSKHAALHQLPKTQRLWSKRETAVAQTKCENPHISRTAVQVCLLKLEQSRSNTNCLLLTQALS
jgi:hypothetical protein